MSDLGSRLANNMKADRSNPWTDSPFSHPPTPALGSLTGTPHTASTSHFYVTLSKKKSIFPRYNMKCRGKRGTTWNIPRIVSRFPRYISCSIAENRLPLGQCRDIGLFVRITIKTFLSLSHLSDILTFPLEILSSNPEILA